MGYRNYIGKISKENYEKIKDLSPTELDNHFNLNKEEDDVYYLSKKDLEVKELYELGSYCDYGYKHKELLTDFFSNKETNELYHNSDTEFQLVNSKDFLAIIIDDYKERVKRMYENLLKDYDRSDLSKLTKVQVMEAFEHISSMSFEWTHLTPYDLDETEKITSSWKYEYAIFELISIYKRFDWDKDVMVYWGE
jgi:hypothetical protein